MSCDVRQLRALNSVLILILLGMMVEVGMRISRMMGLDDGLGMNNVSRLNVNMSRVMGRRLSFLYGSATVLMCSLLMDSFGRPFT